MTRNAKPCPRPPLSEEVASYSWVPTRELTREEARSTYILHRGGWEIPVPSLVHQGLVIWGLTERILSAIILHSTDKGTGGLPGEAGP